MRILALDIATKTGFATDMASGVWDLKLKKGESNGMKLIRLNSKVREVVESLNIAYRDWETDRKSTRLNSSHSAKSRMPSSA